MKQLKLILTVKDSAGSKDFDGNVQFSKDNSTPQDFISAINLFAKAGISVIADIVEVDVELPQN